MKTRIAMTAAALCLSALSACGKQERVREIDWAKAALARNPAYEIVATNETAGVFTVRDTSTGAVHMLRLEELIAAPPPPKVAAQPASPPAPDGVASQTPAAAEAAAAPEDHAASQTTETVAAVPAGNGQSLAAGPGYSITRGEEHAAAGAPTTFEGPGYSITREEPAARQTNTSAEEVVANVEHRSDPIICQGDRLMRIDDQTIDFTGDAVIAEKGCDLYISNARIRAGGVGIIARQARVHIVNSTIGGTRGSYEASEGAEIYVARSTFSGIGRRFDTATMNDLGGNAYQAH
jgi:hypothetical protein